jgi:uncharacterized membrane protein YdbT with pleckstrin-like domain
MAIRWPRRWTRATLTFALELTAIAAVVWALVFVIWGYTAGSVVLTVWFGWVATLLTTDRRPALHTPRSVLRKVRP